MKLSLEDLKPGMVIYGDLELDDDNIWSDDKEINTANVVIVIQDKLFSIDLVDAHIAKEVGDNYAAIYAHEIKDDEFYATQEDAVIAAIKQEREYLVKRSAMCDSAEKWLRNRKNKK